MIEREGTTLTIYCDVCPGYEETAYTPQEFRELVQSVRRQGWRMMKLGERNWMHFCPVCVEEGKYREHREKLGDKVT